MKVAARASPLRHEELDVATGVAGPHLHASSAVEEVAEPAEDEPPSACPFAKVSLGDEDELTAATRARKLVAIVSRFVRVGGRIGGGGLLGEVTSTPPHGNEPMALTGLRQSPPGETQACS